MELSQGDHVTARTGKNTTRLLTMTNPGLKPTRKNSDLRTAVQTRLPQAGATPGASGHIRPRMHQTSPRKAADMQLCLHNKWAILGDSNVGRMPPHDITTIQIDAFPDATFTRSGPAPERRGNRQGGEADPVIRTQQPGSEQRHYD